MILLSVEQVLFVHSRVIAETGGAHGLRDLGLLESAVARPQAAFDGKDMYPTLFEKTAALLDSLVNNHAFVDGNKRTGIVCTGIFMQMNGQELTATQEELENFTMLVATSHSSIRETIQWLENHSRESNP